MNEKFIKINGSRIHYLEEGEGDPILFLHSMPTSSHDWLFVIPELASLGHCIAPDLIGMGESDKPDIEYSIADHISYFNQFIVDLKLKNITLVMHGWGSIIGLDYAMKHEDNCKGLVFYEPYLRTNNNGDLSLPYQEHIIGLDKVENLQDLISNSPYLVEKILQQATLQPLTKEQFDYYCRLFMENNSGKVLYQYWQELPRIHAKNKVTKIIDTYSKKLMHSDLPKLMLYSLPGFVVTMATLMWAKDSIPNLEIAEVGEELHYAHITSPQIVGQTISAWLQGVSLGE